MKNEIKNDIQSLKAKNSLLNLDFLKTNDVKDYRDAKENNDRSSNLKKLLERANEMLKK